MKKEIKRNPNRVKKIYLLNIIALCILVLLSVLSAVLIYQRYYAANRELRSVRAELEEARIDPATRVYLSWGTCEARGVKDVKREDFSSGTYRRNKAVANKFQRKGAQVRLYCQVEGRHCEADWEKQLPVFMNWLWER